MDVILTPLVAGPTCQLWGLSAILSLFFPFFPLFIFFPIAPPHRLSPSQPRRRCASSSPPRPPPLCCTAFAQPHRLLSPSPRRLVPTIPPRPQSPPRRLVPNPHHVASSPIPTTPYAPCSPAYSPLSVRYLRLQLRRQGHLPTPAAHLRLAPPPDQSPLAWLCRPSTCPSPAPGCWRTCPTACAPRCGMEKNGD